MRHTISVLVENRSGVLSRVAGSFSSRGFNIESLTVGETDDPTVSRMTIVVSGDDIILEQVNKQLNRLIDTIKVIDLTEQRFIDRELALIRVSAKAQQRAEVIEIVNIFRAKIVDMSMDSFTIEATGKEEKISAMISMLRNFGIKEVVRTGSVAIARAEQNITRNKK